MRRNLRCLRGSGSARIDPLPCHWHTRSRSIAMDIRTRGTRIHVREQGDGKLALLFLHYWGGSCRTWDGVVGELSSQYRTIATDHRGWGDSDAPNHGYTIADLANDAQDVIEALNLRNVCERLLPVAEQHRK